MLEAADIVGDGGHIKGNFHNYYTFHPVSQRTALIPREFFLEMWNYQGRPRDFFMLDIGCNEGDLSVELLNRAGEELGDQNCNCHMLGIDIDGNLKPYKEFPLALTLISTLFLA